jgi:hypothetical protein
LLQNPQLYNRVDRFFLAQHTKTEKNIPSSNIICIPNGNKIYQNLPLQDPPKFTQIGIFCLKIWHLATLLYNRTVPMHVPTFSASSIALLQCSTSLWQLAQVQKGKSICPNHRNLRTRRRMHLCMQDDQNGQKMMVLTWAEETRLTCFILLQNIFSVVNNLVWQLMLTPLWTCLGIQGKSSVFH